MSFDFHIYKPNIYQIGGLEGDSLGDQIVSHIGFEAMSGLEVQYISR